MAFENGCAACGRIQDACICGRKSAYYRCCACKDDVGKETAIWMIRPDLEKLSVFEPVHDDCVQKYLQQVPFSEVAKSQSKKAPAISPSASVDEDIVSMLDFPPLKITARGTPATIAQDLKQTMVETFHAFLYAAEHSTYTYDPATKKVAVDGFSEKLREMLDTPGRLQ